MTTTSDVFLLTADWHDHRSHTSLRFFGVSPEHGPVEVRIDSAPSVCFIKRDIEIPEVFSDVKRSEVELTDMQGNAVDALYFSTNRSLRKAVTALREEGVQLLEADINPCERFLMERFINGQVRVSGEGRRQGSLLVFHNPHLKSTAVEPEFRVASIDIETGVESGELYSIAADVRGRGSDTSVVLMLGEPVEAIADCEVSAFSTEAELLRAFLDWFNREDPDIIIGWHVIGFDLDFLQKKCEQFNISFALGRERRPIRVGRNARGSWYARVTGRVVIDGPAALRSAFYQFDNYSLDNVSSELLGHGKDITPDEDKIAEIERRFREDRPALARYNLQDCKLVSEIFRETGMINQFIRRTQLSGMLLDQVGRSVAAFDHFFLPRFHRQGMVAPSIDDVEEHEHAAGGYVMEPAVGIHEHVVVLDFKSLYPSIIRTFRIDPLSRIRAETAETVITTPGGYRFSATDHILPDCIAEFMEQREEAKAKNDSHLSQAIKILMNSFYGVMGSWGCRFYHHDLPSGITSTGQWLLQGCREELERQGYAVLYGDTDSVFVRLKQEDESRAEERGEELASMLNVYWDERLTSEFGVTSFLELEYEKYYRKFVLPSARGKKGGAKKRYAGLRVNGEETELHFVGMEFVRTDWTPLARDFQYQLYLRLLTGEDVEDWIRKIVGQVRSGERDEELVYKKRLRKPVDEYTRNIPPQVRAARQLDKPVREVEYVITLSGPVPIQLRPTGIDYQHYIDRQLRPIAETLLSLAGISFDEIAGSGQMSLFP